MRKWYACQVQLQIESGQKIEDVRVDTRLSIMKELGAKWIVAAYDYFAATHLSPSMLSRQLEF